MILADTSVWVEHLRKGNKALAELLDAGMILMHPFVTGEIALSNLRHRKVVLNALFDLALTTVATDNEVLRFVEGHALFGLGIGYVDAHLLAAVQLTQDAALWTNDKALHRVASRLGLAFTGQ